MNINKAKKTFKNVEMFGYVQKHLPDAFVTLFGAPQKKKEWNKMFDVNIQKPYQTLNIKYKTEENYEEFCYRYFMGIDGEANFVSEIENIEGKKLRHDQRRS